MGLEMGGARNGEDMNGEERDDKERTRSHAERLGENELGNSELSQTQKGWKAEAKACQGGYRRRQGTRRGEPAEERSRPEIAAKTKKEEESSFL